MVSAFLNTVKIPELRRRILFTLAVVVIVRLGAAITTPGVNQAVLQEWFRTSLEQRSGGGLAALFNLFSGGALENCAVFSLGIMPYISASIMMQLLTAVIPQLGRLAREDGGRQKIMQLTRYTTVGLCIFQGYLLEMSNHNGDFPYNWRDGVDVAGRSNYRARDWQWDIAYHYHWHRCAPACCARTGVEDICAFGGNRFEPGKSDGPCIACVPLDYCHRCGDCDHARRTQDHCAVRQTGRGPENVRWPDTIHAVEGELCWCHADHLCLGITSVPGHHRQLRF